VIDPVPVPDLVIVRVLVSGGTGVVVAVKYVSAAHPSTPESKLTFHHQSELA
jgi:hypothetical protein